MCLVIDFKIGNILVKETIWKAMENNWTISSPQRQHYDQNLWVVKVCAGGEGWGRERETETERKHAHSSLLDISLTS